MTRAGGSCMTMLQSLSVSDLGGLSGKMCPEFCPAATDGISPPSSGRWKSWGMGVPGGFWTLNGSEFPSGAGVCFLSDVLETQPLPQRFSLSAKACAGILRRASRRGKALPPMLEAALKAAAGLPPQQAP